MELGAYHYKARVYLPHLGIFAQTDPIRHAGGANLYAYVRNDPIGNSDPSGLDPKENPAPSDPPEPACSGSRIPGSCGSHSGFSLGGSGGFGAQPAVAYGEAAAVAGGWAAWYGITDRATINGAIDYLMYRGSLDQVRVAFASWTSRDFVNHYYTGSGEAISLDEVGLGSTFRNHPSVQAAVSSFVSQVARHGRGTFFVANTTTTDVTDTIFSVGHSTFYRSADCNPVSCTFRFGINDSFRDVFGVGLPAGGTPYRIRYFWQEVLEWRD